MSKTYADKIVEYNDRKITRAQWHAMWWNGENIDSNPKFDAASPHRKAYYVVRNLVETSYGCKYDLYRSALHNDGVTRKEFLYAHVRRSEPTLWSPVEYTIVAACGTRIPVKAGDDFLRVGADLYDQHIASSQKKMEAEQQKRRLRPKKLSPSFQACSFTGSTCRIRLCKALGRAHLSGSIT